MASERPLEELRISRSATYARRTSAWARAPNTSIIAVEE
jgi:hypothetical protein